MCTLKQNFKQVKIADLKKSYDADTAENLANEATTTPPPNPAEEGLREQLSGDAVNCFTGGKFQRDARRRSRRRLEEHSRRLVHPQGSSTILEELEEKVRELEEAVSRKEEELRLADTEACELNSQLQSRDVALAQKGEEVEHLNAILASLRQQLVHTMEGCRAYTALLAGQTQGMLCEGGSAGEPVT
nr:uncharacterized protein LOC128694398 [Cherax quadricarinatus]